MANEFYCTNLGCESTGTVHWEPPIRGDLITLGHVPGPAGLTGGHRRGSLITGPCINFLCNPVRLKFSTKGKRFPGWEAGQSWGLRLYQSGYNSGLLFTVRLKVGPIQSNSGHRAQFSPSATRAYPRSHSACTHPCPSTHPNASRALHY